LDLILDGSTYECHPWSINPKQSSNHRVSSAPLSASLCWFAGRLAALVVV
jgi:hypothetical protein